MPTFKFEIVQTVNGLPNPLAYPEGLSHTSRLDGAAMVVYWEFPDEQIAKNFVVCEEYQHALDDNLILYRYKPHNAELDIFYIEELTLEEEQEIKKAKARVLHFMFGDILNQEIFESMTGLSVAMKSLEKPTEKEINLFHREANEKMVEFYHD